MGLDFTLASGCSTGYSCQAAPHYQFHLSLQCTNHSASFFLPSFHVLAHQRDPHVCPQRHLLLKGRTVKCWCNSKISKEINPWPGFQRFLFHLSSLLACFQLRPAQPGKGEARGIIAALPAAELKLFKKLTENRMILLTDIK